MLKFVVISGGNDSTEEQRVNVKKDIVAPIIDDILCNIIKRNTAINSVDKERAKIQQQLGEDVFLDICLQMRNKCVFCHHTSGVMTARNYPINQLSTSMSGRTYVLFFTLMETLPTVLHSPTAYNSSA